MEENNNKEDIWRTKRESRGKTNRMSGHHDDRITANTGMSETIMEANTDNIHTVDLGGRKEDSFRLPDGHREGKGEKRHGNQFVINVIR